MDLVLTIISGLAQGAMATLGIYVSIKAQPPERHRKLVIAFVLLGLTGIVVNACQQYRNSKSQQFLQAQLDGLRLQGSQIKGGIENIKTTSERPLQLQLPVELEKAFRRLAEVQDRSQVSLKRRAAQLSVNILAFLASRRAVEPQLLLGSPEQRDEMLRRYMAFTNETMNQFMTRFQVPCVAVSDELKTKGLDIGNLRYTCEHPTNPLGIEAIGTALGVLSEHIP